MFETNQNSSVPPLMPRKPMNEPEDILDEIDPMSPKSPRMEPMKTMQPPQSFAGSQAPVAGSGVTKKVAPPPNLGSISAPIVPEVVEQRPKQIFSAVDPNPQKPGIPVGLKIKENTEAAQNAFMQDTERRKPLLKSKIFVIIFIILGIGVLSASGFYVYLQLNKAGTPQTDDNSNLEPADNNNVENGNSVNANIQATPSVTPIPDTTPVEAPIDSDSDGLNDEDEKMYSTNPFNSDSDLDGLTDRDETKTWKTDPLNSDTDGDGYSDGEEVNNKYNPLGEGRLIEFPS